MKTILNCNPRQSSDLFLSLIDEEGIIACANATMIRTLELEDPRSSTTSFFDLLHPGHVDDFKRIIHDAGKQKTAAGAELYIKNGYYHPMKWQVNYMEQPAGSKKIFFCVGYKIIDDDRLKKFNELVKSHYQLVMEGLTGIVFHDKKGEIIAANQQTAHLALGLGDQQ